MRAVDDSSEELCFRKEQRIGPEAGLECKDKSFFFFFFKESGNTAFLQPNVSNCFISQQLSNVAGEMSSGR